MLNKSFWQDPVKAFMPGGPMEKQLREYRKITNRTMRLLRVSEECWPVLKSKLPPTEKLNKLSDLILRAEGCGETWAKMLTVCMDLAYPEEHLLESQCDVGIGAARPLRCLMG